MKITCDVIRDLLPLYAEDLASADSRALIEAHLDNCPECQKELAALSTSVTVPIEAEADAAPLLQIKKRLHKKRLQTGMLFALLAFVFAAMVGIFLTAPEYLPYDPERIAIREEQGVFLTLDETIAGYDMTADSKGVYHLTTWQTTGHDYFARGKVQNILLNPDGQPVTAIYYYQGDRQQSQLIYGTPIENGGGGILPRLFLAYYFWSAVLLTLILGGLLFVFRKKKFAHVLEHLFYLSLAYVGSHLLVKGVTMSSYSATRDLLAILLVMFPLYGCWLLIRALKKSRNI